MHTLDYNFNMKKKTRSALNKKLDAVYSKYIRQKYERSWLVECYTCWCKKPVKEMQNWHFISRWCMLLRRDDENCRPQCVWCNIYRGWNYIIYTTKMIKELGQDKVDYLIACKDKIKKRPLYQIEEKIIYYSSIL